MRSIDAWQGREKEYIIFSAVRSNKGGNVGFLENERRVNVALTRAKHGLIIIGNIHTLREDPSWRRLIDFMDGEGVIVNGFDEAKAKIEYY